MRRANAMWLLRQKNKRHYKGQNLIEYATIAAIVAAAAVAMSTYVFRSVQSTQQAIQKEFSKSQ